MIRIKCEVLQLPYPFFLITNMISIHKSKTTLKEIIIEKLMYLFTSTTILLCQESFVCIDSKTDGG